MNPSYPPYNGYKNQRSAPSMESPAPCDGYSNQGSAPPMELHTAPYSPSYVPQNPPPYTPQDPVVQPPVIGMYGAPVNPVVTNAPINMGITGNQNTNNNVNHTNSNIINIRAVPTVQIVHYNDYIGLSICTLLYCFLPIGIAAVVFSCKTQNALMRNDLVLAKSESNTTFVLNMVNLGAGVAVHAIWIGLLLYASTSHSYYG